MLIAFILLAIVVLGFVLMSVSPLLGFLVAVTAIGVGSLINAAQEADERRRNQARIREEYLRPFSQAFKDLMDKDGGVR